MLVMAYGMVHAAAQLLQPLVQFFGQAFALGSQQCMLHFEHMRMIMAIAAATFPLIFAELSVFWVVRLLSSWTFLLAPYHCTQPGVWYVPAYQSAVELL